jgi:hypothetical protein
MQRGAWLSTEGQFGAENAGKIGRVVLWWGR